MILSRSERSILDINKIIMPRPTTKASLLAMSQTNFQALNDYIDSLSDESIHTTFPEGTMNRNIRDVLAHLHHWHLLFLEWYRVGMNGTIPVMPALGYRWKDTPQLNRKIWEDYQNTGLDEIRKLLFQSHAEIRQIITQHTEEELFEKQRYPWTGTTSLASYLISATSSHYDWGLRLVRKALK